MEIRRDALLRLVRAARMTDKLAQDMRGLLTDELGETVADIISGHLMDVLFSIGGEKLEAYQDFGTTKTMDLIRGKLDDEEATDAFIRMAYENRMQIPLPKFISREEFRKSVQENGGYLFTPEGEFVE